MGILKEDGFLERTQCRQSEFHCHYHVALDERYKRNTVNHICCP